MTEPDTSLLKKLRWQLFLLGVFKIPMIGYVRPRLVHISDNTSKVRIKLKRKTVNHLSSMYFGALMVGADVASGIHIFYCAKKMNKKVSFSFKSVHANFLKRADSNTLFLFEEGKKVAELMQKSLIDKTRVNDLVKVLAYNTSNELVAEFEMELSVKII